MVKKFLVLVAALMVMGTGVAHAGDGYSDQDFIVTDEQSYAPGEEITITAQTFVGEVSFTLFSAPVLLGTATANASGVATLVTRIPAGTTPGTHTVEASGTGIDGQPLVLRTTITVTGAGAGGGSGTGAGTLPKTGSSNSVPMSQIALGAIAGGGLLVLVANKRRKTADSLSV